MTPANKEILDKILAENDGKNYYIQCHRGRIITKWALYPSMTVTVEKKMRTFGGSSFFQTSTETTYLRGDENQRQILPHEIVIDIDTKDEALRNEATKKIIEYLNNENISHQIWFSGGKSFHIHLLFPELKTHPQDIGLISIKRAFLNRIQKLINPAVKIDMTKASIKTLIQLEGMPHWRTGKTKTLIAEVAYKEHKLPLAITGSPLQELGNEVMRRGSRDNYDSHSLVRRHSCLDYLYNNKLPDGHHRAAFVILSDLMSKTDEQTALIAFQQWNDVQQHYFTQEEIERMWKYQRNKNHDRKPGCRYIHDILREIGLETIAQECEMKVRI